ncbi:hypothetical protein [Maricaulis maris]|uniref:hypothetical protein n=1 Tax=Maricaulis maris TaxID=74318 RepID=UPI000EAC5331|nr:hypothetical protein [Maricaulis maris]
MTLNSAIDLSMTPVAFPLRLIQFQTELELKTKLPAWIDAMLHNNDTGGNFFFKLCLLQRNMCMLTSFLGGLARRQRH